MSVCRLGISFTYKRATIPAITCDIHCYLLLLNGFSGAEMKDLSVIPLYYIYTVYFYSVIYIKHTDVLFICLQYRYYR